MHCKVLLAKNFKLLTRLNYLPIMTLLSPLFLLLTISLLQSLADHLTTQTIEPEPEIEGIGRVCGVNTVKIGFTHGTIDWTDYVVERMKEKLDKIEVLIYHDMNQSEFQHEMKRNDSSIGVYFCTQDIEIGNNTVPCAIPQSDSEAYIYVIVYNFTYPNELLIRDWMQNEVVAMKMVVDNSISAWVSSKFEMTGVAMEVEIQSYPKLDRFLSTYNVLSASGSTYLVLTSFLLSALIVQEVTKEKSEFLKVFLSIHEVSQFDYWLSWILILALIALVSSVQIPLIGSLVGFEEFGKIPYLLQVILFLLINLNGVLIGSLAAVSINDIKLANTVSLCFVVIGLCIQVIVRQKQIIVFLHHSELPFWAQVLKVILYLYPPYNFGIVFLRLFTLAGVHFDYHQMAWADGREVFWSDLLLSESGQNREGKAYYVPCPLVNFAILGLSLIILPLILAYLDHVITNNRIYGKSWDFILRTKANLIEEEKENNSSIENKDLELRQSLLKSRLKLTNVCKQYKNAEVLKGFNLNIDSDLILAIVGENGAGKSTLLGIIAGIIPQTSGDVLSETKRFCPQRNVFWDVMTVDEHFKFFEGIYGVNKSQLMKDVGLEAQKHVLAGKLSGGMKRRLSLALSVFGEPRVLLLDEPTTGLDPIMKRQIWKLILSLGQSRLLVFTSHSIDEVFYLSDSCISLKEGSTSFHLPIQEVKMKLHESYKIEITYSVQSFPLSLQSLFPSLSILSTFNSSACTSAPSHKDFNTLHTTISKSSPDLPNLTQFLDSAGEVCSWSILPHHLTQYL